MEVAEVMVAEAVMSVVEVAAVPEWGAAEAVVEYVLEAAVALA